MSTMSVMVMLTLGAFGVNSVGGGVGGGVDGGVDGDVGGSVGGGVVDGGGLAAQVIITPSDLE